MLTRSETVDLAGARCRIEHFGHQGEPVVTIDDFYGDPDSLERAGRAAIYSPVQGYPGIRARVGSGFMAARTDLLRQVLADVFGLANGPAVESCAFSLVSLTPEELTQGQRRPHYDAADDKVIAMVHFLGNEASGGTAFYRHRRTGFEAIHPDREAQFHAAIAADEAQFGPLPAAYFHGDDARYEQIGEVAALRDRVVIYRGRVLHSGVIPVAPDPATVRETGRLTVNTFLVGRT
jgi:hypothetical protein